MEGLEQNLVSHDNSKTDKRRRRGQKDEDKKEENDAPVPPEVPWHQRWLTNIKEFCTFPPIPDEHKYALSPFEKFWKYRRLPCKFLLNILILATLFTVVFSFQLSRNAYDSANRRVLTDAFLPEGYADPETSMVALPTYTFFSLTELVDFIETSVMTYYTLVKSTPGLYMYYVTSDNNTELHTSGIPDATLRPLPPVMQVDIMERSYRYYDGNLGQNNVSFYNLTQAKPLGPLSVAREKAKAVRPNICKPRQELFSGQWYQPCRVGRLEYSIFDSLNSIKVTMLLRAVRLEDPGTGQPSSVQWNIEQNYDFSNRGIVRLQLTLASFSISEADGITTEIVLSVILCVLSVWDILLRGKSVKNFKQFEKAFGSLLGGGEKSGPDANRHTLGATWMVWALISDVLSLTAGILQIVNNFTLEESENLFLARNLVLGTAGFFSSVLCVSYFRHIPKFYFLTQAMSFAMPHLSVFLVGVLPIFFGYAFCGYVVFGSYTPQFSTFDYACVSLYCALNGDSMLSLFTAVSQTNNTFLEIFARVYMFSFVSLFIYAALNITLAIVQDSYCHVKETFGLYQHEAPIRKAAGLSRADVEKALEQLQGIIDNIPEDFEDEEEEEEDEDCIEGTSFGNVP